MEQNACISKIFYVIVCFYLATRENQALTILDNYLAYMSKETQGKETISEGRCNQKAKVSHHVS